MTRWLLILTLLIPSVVNAQQAVWTNARGATTSGYPTSTILDADHRLLDIRCWAGCSAAATQDVNVTQLLGVAPAVTNPFPMRLSTGVAFYDARDRSWTLSSGTDSVAVTGSVTANAGTNLNTSALLLDATFTGRTPAALVGGRFDVNAGAWLGSTAPTVGQKTMANSVPVVLPSDQSAVPVSGTVTANDGSHTNTSATMNNDGACPSGAANFTVLASNASRKKAYLAASPANTDDVFVKFGVTATSSDFRLAPGQPINEVPVNSFVYTGQIDAIPASGTQAVCVMEFN